MWATEHSIETNAPPEAVWRLWADVADWPDWNADLARAELVGEFLPGSTIRMTSRDGDSVDLRIAAHRARRRHRRARARPTDQR